ncbi:uncharacterized protein BDW43DRAFT_321254 [Aspergillus alliaceus]|uniref:uncharacterized protein n=1 Tax=Petromyces alliaceus TaxID=209559 RepID=UPI0012A40C87|nr:uncharacterized protein BDW43DRAFT_321254 [Aspergillus alliaceus]KAB8238207.1 hypothetical protein BDW43DRAFT_321254 [Aspergillus alliaceus]
MSFGFSIGDLITVIEHANKLRKDFRSAPIQFKALSDVLGRLSIAMRDVEVDLSNTDLSNQQEIELQKIADSCRQVFNEFEQVASQYCELSESCSLKRVWKRLKWEPNNVCDLRNRICSNICVLIAFNGRITRDRVTALLKNRTNEHHQIYLDWLSPTVYATQQCDCISRRQPETGEWLLPQQTLFCPGIPGAGKTILSSVVIEELESRYGDNRDIGVAYISCSFQTIDDRIQHPECLFASILRQLVQGVDECRFTAMSRLLDEIFGLQATNDVNLLATARFIPGITAKFLGKPTKEIRASKPDEILNGITDSLESLIGKRLPRAIRSQLKDLISGSRTYDSAYDNAIQRIEGQVTDQKDLAWQCLSWIICAKRPLTTVELRSALAVEIGESEFDGESLLDLDDIVSVCAGLITVTADPSDNIIRLGHYKAQEYFERTWTRRFLDPPKDIASICVTYLSFDAFLSGICLSDAEYEARLEEYPLYSYAARNWGHHARMQPISEDLMIRFLGDTLKVNASA